MNKIKNRKSLLRVDSSPDKSKKDKLIDDLGLGNFKSDITNPNVWKSEETDLSKAGSVHIPINSSRFTYQPSSEWGVIYIPTNRLKQVYQTDRATDRKKVEELKRKMRLGKKLEPVQVGYDYDVHDGHHRWEACKDLGYSHVPCEVVGTDKMKVMDAKRRYRKVWKSDVIQALEGLVPTDKTYAEFVIDSVTGQCDISKSLDDVFLQPMLGEVLDDTELWYMKCAFDYHTEGKSANSILKSMHHGYGISTGMDLFKALNKAKLVRKRVRVQGKDGKFYYRMQWVKPGDTNPMYEPTGSKEHTTYDHHENEIKELERRQRNRFPVVRANTSDIKIERWGYKPDKDAIGEAIAAYDRGEKLPPIRVDGDGVIIRGYEYYEMAKELGLSHIPVIVFGNTTKKKDFEDKNRESAYVEERDGDEVHRVKLTHQSAPHKNPNLPKEVLRDIDHFTKVTTRQYSKEYIMNQAIAQGIEFDPCRKDGSLLPLNSSILWMRAHQAITKHISEGKSFEIEHSKEEKKRHMKDTGKDSVHRAFLDLLEQFDGDKQEFMEFMSSKGITWPEKKDPSINWMECVKAVKKQLGQGKMISGIRTREKGAMEKANMTVTDHMKNMVKEKADKYGKVAVMDRAEQLGIQFSRVGKDGEPLAVNSRILWMRASQAISEYIALGNEFLMEGEVSDTQGLAGETGADTGLTKWPQHALDWAIRNSREQEKKVKDYAIKCFKTDRGATDEEAEQLYNKFMENARSSRVMVKIDPFEMLPNGNVLIDELMSEGTMKNNIVLGRGSFDKENVEANEGDLFGDEYTTEVQDKERPVYGIVDLFHTGLDTGSGRCYHTGDVAFVMKDHVRDTTTACHIDSNSFPYGEEGKWVKPMSDPHQLLIDRFRYKWKKPNKKDAQRKRAMDAIINGESYTEDTKYFECHLHKPLDISADVDYMIVPNAWKTDTEYSDHISFMQEFSNTMGIPIKYE